MPTVSFFDLEVNPSSKQILDIGAISSDGLLLHRNDLNELVSFLSKADFICGHNIINHDLIYIAKHLGANSWGEERAIDTLFLSPLLFPKNPYHNLLKDDKLQTDELNNPLNDSQKAKNLFFDEVAAFQKLDDEFKEIIYLLLFDQKGFSNFFQYLQYLSSKEKKHAENLIWKRFQGKICSQSELASFIEKSPIALAYTLALLNCDDRYSITPPWVLRNYPEVERLIFLMKNNPCISGCDYCKLALNPILALKKHFGFSIFRTYNEEPLQQDAVDAAIRGESILAVFPTGGGKSITFQVPALMSGENAKALTVVISPLQSLMKDQVDNLEKKGITEAVTINGLLDPIERSKAIERIENGLVSLLYISPESLRSITIERLLLKRKIARFVIDEAHCFSSWGQDFRVDYLYIGDFIKSLQEKKGLESNIPVSCFTATAKQKVIEDIRSYFKEKLNLNLNLFRANASRTNLHYSVYQKDNEEEKYSQLRSIIEANNCPTIVYVSRTKKAYKLAKRLNDDGFVAKPYHGKMDKDEKSENQNAFMSGDVNIMVATSAFGMGVDKSDVGVVIHYDISDSLENYVQEAGRAGRDENISANCYVLFNEEDLDKHFILLNQTKISSKEINQIWKAIKELTKTRDKVSNSALEIARKAGWDDGINEVETRVTTAIAALEDAGYLKRGQNMPKVFANSILSKNAQEALDKINSSEKFSDSQKSKAARIIKKLFSSKSKRLSTEEMAESRIDYISDQLGIVKEEVIRLVEIMREEGILAQTRDLTIFVKKSDSVNKSLAIAESFRKQEELLLNYLNEGDTSYHLKEVIEFFLQSGVKDSSLNKLKTILNFWSIKNWIKKHNLEYSKNHLKIGMLIEKSSFQKKQEKRHLLAKSITEYLYKKASELSVLDGKQEEILIESSIQELKEIAEKEQSMFSIKATIDDIEDTLFYLSRIEAIKIEGGFLVVHNKLTIDRIEMNNRIQYKESDYEKLKQFYQQKVQQIHIVGEYAKKMIRNYNEALQFVDDYFRLNYFSFLSKYFPGSRQEDIKRTLTPEKFMKLFGTLSANQLEIIKDSGNQYIVVAAGPGSGKTRVLVHKLASLLLTEDVKHEQLLMLTFSRAAATEFKKRLIDLIGNAANFIEIKTFHSYCFDLLGRVGSLFESEKIISTAVNKIRSGEIEPFRITKSVLVVDEAQDMNKEEYELVKVLMEQNEEMRVILVGDDDQNIYGFRGADSAFMQSLVSEKAATKYQLTENYRSTENLVSFANNWAATISKRRKATTKWLY
ncbi:MAG: RecQ family ATP-dependent DNA helicase [Chitinophagaceae bacterium]|nr:RecQ family ATP-dependent DNA helicase [Chitinophagaceae bacterium]